MLPGFRFLFAAIVLSMSILVFGLGAAALLRAAHEEFANHPSRRAPPEPVFARLNDDPMPSLALLRVDLPVAEKPLDDGRAAAVPEIAPDIVAPAGTAADERPAEPVNVAALSTEERPPAPATEAVKDRPHRSGPRPPLPNVEVVAAIAETSARRRPPPRRRNRRPMHLKATPPRPGSPRSVAPLLSSTKRISATPDRSTIRKRAVQRARERRRIALARRARLAREATLTLQQQHPNPFVPAPATAPAPTPLLRFTR